MKNYGDICTIDGGLAEPVDCIIGGSPCQNLSIAGNRLGLDGNESRLFLEQMRLIREMRQASNFTKPRYMVWENVCGALSCNKGKDFQAVLDLCVRTCVITRERESYDYAENHENKDEKYSETPVPDVPMPKDGKWPNAGVLYDDLGRWSLAWRVHDAQFWGVAQRRRRIALVVDFGGMSAPEVLFECEGVSGNTDESGAQRERTSDNSGRGAAKSDTGRTATCVAESTGQSRPVIAIEGNGSRPTHKGPGFSNADVSYTLNTVERHAVAYKTASVYDARGNGSGETCTTITGDHDNRITDYTNVLVERDKLPVYCIGNGQVHDALSPSVELCKTLNCLIDPMKIAIPLADGSVNSEEPWLLESNQNHATVTNTGVSTTLPASMGLGGGYIPMVTVPSCEKSDACASRFSINGDAHVSGRSCLEEVSHTPKCTTKESVVVPDDANNSPIVIDRSAFNQGKNAMYGLHIGEDGIMPPFVINMQGCKGQSSISQNDTSYTIMAMHGSDVHAVCCQVNEEVYSVHENGCQEVHLNKTAYPLTTYKVRRLTPLECTRLQGYPDGWVDIGDWTDTKGKKHKEADAPKYKALGNSIALPFWRWLCRNIITSLQSQGNTHPTMASLFDGIGGFPLCWNSEGGRTVWISEIDEFPIAVTRKHFGE